MRLLFLCLLLFGFVWANEYEAWLKKEQQQFASYKKSHDEAFSDAIKKEWEAFEAQYTLNPYETPKPVELPRLEEESKLDIPLLENSLLAKVKISPPNIEKTFPKTPLPFIKKEHASFKEISVDFYSHKISVSYNPHIGFLLTSVSKEAIAGFWERFSKVDHQHLIKQIQFIVEHYGLNDWATYLLVHKIGMQIYQLDNMANLFTWYVLTQMNYDVKIGYSKQTVYLLAHMQHELFQVSFLTLQGNKYYVLHPKGSIRTLEPIYTYNAQHQKAQTALSFEFKKPLLFNTHYANKALHFKYNNQVYTIESQYSTDLVEFYKTFPQSDYPIYFNANNSSFLHQSLLLSLKPLLENQSEVEAVNMLLRFVQTAFAYQTDKEQFNYEKVFFPEETLFYPYSDCEDRTILFAFLVKHLLNLNVIALRYKDHMTAAVEFSTQPKLDGFVHKNRYYTFADPTYVNANIGMRMPKYQHQRFDIIE